MMSKIITASKLREEILNHQTVVDAEKEKRREVERCTLLMTEVALREMLKELEAETQ